MKKRILVVGGTSGVGLELAKYYSGGGHTVCVTGSTDPSVDGVGFEKLHITGNGNDLVSDIDRVVDNFTSVNTIVYAAGFLQRGYIDELPESELQKMVNVGLTAPMLFAQKLKNRLDTPLKIMLITSSSQYTPRELEPAYCATKAGLGMLGASLVRDKGIGKVLVAAPSGIDSAFWKGTDVDTSSMLKPVWVAEQIVELSSGPFKYKYAKILRNPARVEVQEVLDSELMPQ